MIALYFFFNDTATTEIYTLSLHDALPILVARAAGRHVEERLQDLRVAEGDRVVEERLADEQRRSEEHTSELQSRQYLVCRLLLEKKKSHSKFVSYLLVSEHILSLFC